MLKTGIFTPASNWRAFFVVLSLAGAVGVRAAPPSGAPPPPLAQYGKPDAAESARILDQFRHAGWFGYVQFDLDSLPRRGDEVVYHGRLWGGRDAQGAVTRIEVQDAHGAVSRFLLQNGEEPAVWRLADGKVEKVTGAALFQPLIPGVQVTAFDLQMPYLYWPGAHVDSVARVRGRPTYVFVFQPPSAFAGQNPQLKSVRAYFDAQFDAPIEIQLADADRVVKTTSLIDLKKVGEQWIPKSFDVRDDVTRDKTRFEVTAVALGLRFGAAEFAPASLAHPAPVPQAERIVSVGQ